MGPGTDKHDVTVAANIIIVWQIYCGAQRPLEVLGPFTRGLYFLSNKYI